MKKVLVFMLAAVLVLSSVLLIACNANVVEVKFKEDTIPTDVKRNDAIDYSLIKIVVTYDNETTAEMSLTDKGVTYQGIDTSTTGNKTLTVNFGGKSAQTVIKVQELDVEDYTVTGFENTDGYRAYLEAIQEKENKEIEFFNREDLYTVGFVNGYKFIPKTTATDGTDAVTNDNVKTTYKLSVKSGSSYTELSGTELTKYLSKVENNIYYFTEEADGKQFKLDVTLDESYETILSAAKKTVSQEFVVVNGYNAYDALGLSVLDNLNTKSWANIKNRKLEWDTKKLNEYGDVKQVILHNNITVSKSDLPGNYFWTEGETSDLPGTISYKDALGRSPADLKPLLEGSLKEINLGEEWENNRQSGQRGLYVSDGIGLLGNYLNLSYSTGLVITGEGDSQTVTAPNGGIYVVNDYTQETNNTKIYPEGHWNFISFRCKTEEAEQHKAEIKNVRFVGQTQKTENTKIPCGLGMISSELLELKVDNTIGTKWFFNFNIDANTGNLTLDKSKFYDSFSQMLFSYYGSGMNVTNTALKRAGGPLIILQTPSYASGSSGALDDDWTNAMDFNIDSTNDLENWLTGQEVWFSINAEGKSAAINQMFSMNKLLETQLGKKYIRKVGSGQEEMTQYNALMLLIPAPGDIFDNQKHLAGSITIGDSVYSMDDPILNIKDTLQKLVDLANTVKDAVGSNAQLEQLIAGAEALRDDNALTLLTTAPLHKSGNNYAYNNPSFEKPEEATLFVVPAVIKVLKQLSDGANGVVEALQANLTQIQQGIENTENSGGDATQLKAQAAAITVLISQWQAWIESVKPMTDLAETASDADNQILAKWKANWQDSENYTALWINPAPLGASGNQYFMIIFGEAPAEA